jgi:peptidyl-prolyl cis-trans isomerase A (cyclophilin A)
MIRYYFSAFLLYLIIICILFLPAGIQAQPLPGELPLHEAAPDSFSIVFETTKGDFTVLAIRDWSPMGVDRLYHLVNGGYYDGVIIFRVGGTMSATGRVAQFGITNNADVNRAWEPHTIKDEPVMTSNVRGTILFARGGPDTRGTQIALNLTDNPGLDTVDFEGVTGFPPLGRVTEGMHVADSFFSKYGNEPSMVQDSILAKGGEFLDRVFPGLDRITRARIIK